MVRFGLVKRRLRRERVSCLDDLAAVVEVSAESNVAELVGREDGTRNIPVYNWSEFLAPHFKKVPQLKSYHHMTFSSEAPGALVLKLAADSEEELLQLLRDGWQPSPRDLPAVIPPPGLTMDRQWYLYNHIREYCTEATKDVVCPRPTSPRTSMSAEGTEGR